MNIQASTEKEIEFRGSWAGLPVPWDANDTFDEGVYREDIARCAEVKIPGIYTGGTTGEFYAQDWEEFCEITRVTVDQTRKMGIPAMIGVTALDTRLAVKKAEFAAKAGADAIQVAFPFWLEIKDPEVIPFIEAVSSASGNLPLSLYESGRAKKHLTLDKHLRLREKVPAYRMVKATVAGADTVTPKGCEALTRAGIAVFADEGTYWPKLMDHGVAGCCSSFVYYAPRVVMPMNEALQNQDKVALERGAAILGKLLEFLIENHISRGLYDSAIDRLGGYAIGILKTGLKCRPPYQSATEEDARALKSWWARNFPDV